MVQNTLSRKLHLACSNPPLNQPNMLNEVHGVCYEAQLMTQPAAVSVEEFRELRDRVKALEA
jgi:hypothetical protein